MRRVTGTHFIAMTGTGRAIAIADRWIRNADLYHKSKDHRWYLRTRLRVDAFHAGTAMERFMERTGKFTVSNSMFLPSADTNIVDTAPEEDCARVVQNIERGCHAEGK